MLAETKRVSMEWRALERAEIVNPGERMTKGAVAAFAMYISEWWFEVPPTGPTEFNGCVYLTIGEHTSVVRTDVAQGVIPWR